MLVFKESCHSCGGCEMVCPSGAISYEKRNIGQIKKGKTISGNLMEYGLLNLGELSGVKIIEKLRENVEDKDFVIIDSPPGTACSTVAAVEGVDYAVLVTEPTPFGLSDMKMVVDMLREMKIPFGVFVNKAGLGDDEVYKYCHLENIPLLGEIPFDTKIAEFYSKGHIFSTELSEYREVFVELSKKIKGYLKKG